MSPPSIIVCGNLTIDELVRDGEVTVSPGGSALFVTSAAAYLGADVGILGNIGTDYPSVVLRRLRTLNLDTHLLRRTETPTTRFHITRFNGSRKVRLLHPGEPIVQPQSMRTVRSIHLGSVFNEISTSLVKALREKCDVMSADLQGFIRVASNSGLVNTIPRDIGMLLKQCDILQASLEDARSQTQFRDPRKILKLYLKSRVRYGILTMGKRGSWLWSKSDPAYQVPAFPERHTTDSTGAGDIFAGSWLTTYQQTHDPLWASAVGTAFASLGSRRIGLLKFHVRRSEMFRRASWVYNHVKRIST